MLRHAIEMTLRQDLLERADDISVQLQLFGPHPDLEQTQSTFDTIYRFRDDGKWLQILDQDGHWVYRSQRMAALRAPLTLPQALPSTGLTATMLQLKGRSVRTLSIPLNINGVAYSVETGISLSKPFALLRTFGLSLLFLTPAVVFAAAAAGYLISRKALSPVALITAEARRISDRNLETRLPVSAANDELSDLSVTLNKMLARIDVGFRSVRDFTANASHELRTPLARLRTEIEIALMRPREPAEYRDSLDHLHQASIDMSNLIDSLLAIARAEAGPEILRLTPVDLSSLLESITDEWTRVAAQLGLNFRIVTIGSDDPSLHVFGDRLSLVRLLRVLLDNAFKFTPYGGSVTIVSTATEKDVLLSVEDTGPGIAPEHHASIFERFFRVHGDTTRQQSGAGLGLSLAAWIARHHNTTLCVESALGCGARFQLSLTRVFPTDVTPAQIIQTAPDRDSVVDLHTS
jgi:signal transduction histidine kinase